jgi:hypothetical protein
MEKNFRHNKTVKQKLRQIGYGVVRNFIQDKKKKQTADQ